MLGRTQLLKNVEAESRLIGGMNYLRSICFASQVTDSLAPYCAQHIRGAFPVVTDANHHYAIPADKLNIVCVNN